VEVSDGATVVLTGKVDVMALHQYAVKKLGARQHGIQKIQARPVNRNALRKNTWIVEACSN
jgi:hypothetical protein